LLKLKYIDTINDILGVLIEYGREMYVFFKSF